MSDKMAISVYIFKIVEKGPFLRLHMRAKEMFNHYQLSPTASASQVLSDCRQLVLTLVLSSDAL